MFEYPQKTKNLFLPENYISLIFFKHDYFMLKTNQTLQ